MANYDSLINAVKAAVKTNGTGAITGATLQATLLGTIEELTVGFQFMGVATPSTSPDSNDKKEFYLGFAGTYANFGSSVTVPEGSVILFKKNDSAWSSQVVKIADPVRVSDLNKILGDSEDISSDMTITSDKFINKDGDVVSFTGAQYGIIQLNVGDVLDFTVEGNEFIALLSKTDASGSTFQSIIVGKGSSSQLQTSNILYVIEEQGYYAVCTTNQSVFSCLNRYNTPLSEIGKVGSIESLQSLTEVLNVELGKILGDSEDISSDMTITSDKFINRDGDVVSFTGAQYGIIQLNVGDVLDFTVEGNELIALLSKTDADGNFFKSIIVGKGGGQQLQTSSYLYVIEESGYYAICTTNSSVFVCLNRYNTPLEQMAKKEKPFYSVSMFESIACCGDSYVKGQIYNVGGLVGDKPNLSWGKNIGRIEGIEAKIYASSGADTNTWQSRSDCLPLALSENASGLYIFCLGINDVSYVTKGSITDITNYDDFHDYPNTYYGNYGKIIEQIMEHAPNSKIIIMTPCNKDYVDWCLIPIKEITQHYGIAMINTLKSDYINSNEFNARMISGHPTAALHSNLAIEIIKLISDCINDNYDYFKTYVGV